MPVCPNHPGIALKPMKKGWYCEECESNVLSYEQHPRPDDTSSATPAPATLPAAAPSSSTALDLDALPFPLCQ